jgi:hypothetical protein
VAPGQSIGWGVPTVTGDMEDWAASTVTFVTPNVEGMPTELADYLGLGTSLLGTMELGTVVTTQIEPFWDGCDGRWLNIRQAETRAWQATMCATALLEPGRIDHPPPDLARGLRVLEADGWVLIADSDNWGVWSKELPAQANLAAEIALRASLALWGVYDPRNWFVAMNAGIAHPVEIDLRRWRQQTGLVAPPPTIAPYGTEVWAILCECGLHEMHEAPCWEGSSSLP